MVDRFDADSSDDGSGDEADDTSAPRFPRLRATCGNIAHNYRNDAGYRWTARLLVMVLFLPTLVGTPLSILFAEDIVVFRPLFDVNWWKPKWHGLFWAVYSTPHMWVYPLFILGFSYGGFRLWGRGKANGGRVAKTVAVVLFALAVYSTVVWGYATLTTNLHANEQLAAEYAPQVENGTELPAMDPQDPRIATRDYARTLAESQFRSNKYQLGKSDDITFLNTTGPNGEPLSKSHWVYPREPGTLPKTFFGHQRGFVHVEMDTRESGGQQTQAEDCVFEYGFGVGVTDNVKWQLYHNRPYTQRIESPFPVEQNGQCYIVAPKMGKDYHVDWFMEIGLGNVGTLSVPAPVVFTTPDLEAVDVVHETGRIESLSPQVAATHPATAAQNYVPYGFSRTVVMSLKWHENGYWRMKWNNNENYAFAATSKGNTLPYLIKTPDGSRTYMFPMKPAGENSRGVYRIYTMNGQTMELTRYNSSVLVAGNSSDATLTGPSRAAGYLKQTRSEWFTSDTYKISEALPVKRNGTLYWMYRVTSDSGKGAIHGVGFVSAEDPENNAVMFDENEAAKAVAFMRGTLGVNDSKTVKTTDTDNASDSKKVVLVMEDTNGDGTPDTVVDSFTIESDKYVAVSPAKNGTANSTANATG